MRLKAIELFKTYVSVTYQYPTDELEEAIRELEAINKELEQGQENYNKLWDMYSELKDKLKKAQSYIVDLENRLKDK